MCTCILNLKAMPVNNVDAHLQTQNLGEKLVIFEALFKAFPVFNVLETCRAYLLTIDLGIVIFIKKIVEIRKRTHRICSNFAIIEAIMAVTNSLKRFLKKTPAQRNTKINKKRNGVSTLPWRLRLQKKPRS